jgi:drug/metabolite transporter (DMT)-like permease
VITYLQLLLTIVFWAATFHFGKHAVALMPPLGVSIWRFVLAGAALLPVMLVREPIAWSALRRNAWPLLIMGVVGNFGFNAGMFFGLQHTSAVNASLITASNPALIVVLAAWLHREPVGARRLLGLGLGLAGVLVVVTRGSWQVLRDLELSRGDLMLLGGTVCWAIYSVIPRLYIRGLGPLQIAGATIGIGVLAMAACGAVAEPAALALPPAGAWLALLFMGVLGGALAYMWWNQGVVRVGPQRAAIFLNLTPVFTALIGVALGESISLAQGLGALLVIAGVLTVALTAGS